MQDTFKVVVPAEISKADDGSYKIRGLATDQTLDSQAELLRQTGMDLTPIDENRGVLNWDHGKDPTDIIGILDGYQKTKAGLIIEGTLFKRHTKANAVREIMQSLGEKDKGRMGLSVEGEVLQRNAENPSIIERSRINAVALTMNPVNSNTHVALVKSWNTGELDFQSVGRKAEDSDTKYSPQQVLNLLVKALGIGPGVSEAPNTKTGGDALALENLTPEVSNTEKEFKKKKKLTKAQEIEGGLHVILDKLQILYPLNTKEDLWGAIKKRLNTKFPTL